MALIPLFFSVSHSLLVYPLISGTGVGMVLLAKPSIKLIVRAIKHLGTYSSNDFGHHQTEKATVTERAENPAILRVECFFLLRIL